MSRPGPRGRAGGPRSKWGWWKTEVEAIESIQPFAPKWILWESFLAKLVTQLGTGGAQRLYPRLVDEEDGSLEFEELAERSGLRSGHLLRGTGVFPAFLVEGFEVLIEPWGSMCIDRGVAPWKKKKTPWMQQQSFLPFAVAESEARVNLIEDEEDPDFFPKDSDWICDIWIGIPEEDKIEEEWPNSPEYSLIQIGIWRPKNG